MEVKNIKALIASGIRSVVLHHGRLATYQLSQNQFDNESKKNIKALIASGIQSVVLQHGRLATYQLSQNHFDNKKKSRL